MELPPELLARVIGYLDPADTSTALELCRFSECSRLFHSVASSGQLWRQLYVSRWRRHRSQTSYLELLLRDNDETDGTDWKAAYGHRHIQDLAALQCVKRMVGEPIGRYSEAKYILEDAQMGVFDSLLKYQRQLANDYAFYERLAEKLWVREVLDALRRSESIQTWHQLLFEQASSEATVACISAFSGFRGADRADMEDKFERLADFTRERLGAEYLNSHPDQREVSKAICQAMAAKGIRPSSPQTFHRLQNAFLNLVIDNGATTLPMSLVCIFCAIAHRLGLRASIINFPNRILARIEDWADSEDESVESYIIDVFEYGEVLSEMDITNRLSFIGIPQSSAPNFLHSAAPSEVITRVGRNIIESLTREEGGIVGSNDNSRSAHAAVAALLFVQPMVDALPNILYQFPMDVFSIERDYIPIVQREGVEGFLMADRLRLTQRSIIERDSQPIEPRIRANEIKEGDKEILYHIGTIFRHRRWGYIGVIKRWDPRCSADEVWIQGNNVDALDNGGRHQPFYSISADDGSDRYIAQVNVIPMKSVHPQTVHRLINMHENLGWTFIRADPERGIFEMDHAHKRKYPEDAKWQQDSFNLPVM